MLTAVTAFLDPTGRLRTESGDEREDPKTKVFVSYRRADSEYAADRITERLAAHFGKNEIVYDIDTIPFGEDYRSYISDQIAECGVLLAIIGRSWLDMRAEGGPRDGERRIDEPNDLVSSRLTSRSISWRLF